MNAPILHVDDASTAVFNRQLETVKAKSFDEKSRPLKGLALVPITSEAHPGATTITYRSYKGVGVAKFISDYASGKIPDVTVIGSEVSQKMRTFANKFNYSVQELEASRMTGMPLNARKIVEARKATEQLLNRTCLLGESSVGLRGLLNFPGNTEYTVPADGTGSSKTWATKTPAQIVRDIRGLINAVAVTTNGVEVPNTVGLPQTQFSYLESTIMSSGSDTTILQFLKKNFSDITNWVWLSELATIGTGGTARMWCGVVDTDHVNLEVPTMFTMLPPQAKALAWDVPCYGRTGGILEFYPLAFAYGDGI